MTPIEAREWAEKLQRLSTGRDRIARAEERLQTDLVDALKDDDLIVIFIEEALKR